MTWFVHDSNSSDWLTWTILCARDNILCLNKQGRASEDLVGDFKERHILSHELTWQSSNKMTSDTSVWTNAAVYEDALTWKCDDLDDEQLDMKMIWLWYGRVCYGHGDRAVVDLNWFLLIEQQRLNKMIDVGSNVMNRLIWCVCTAVRKDDHMMLAAIW